MTSSFWYCSTSYQNTGYLQWFYHHSLIWCIRDIGIQKNLLGLLESEAEAYLAPDGNRLEPLQESSSLAQGQQIIASRTGQSPLSRTPVAQWLRHSPGDHRRHSGADCAKSSWEWRRWPCSTPGWSSRPSANWPIHLVSIKQIAHLCMGYLDVGYFSPSNKPNKFLNTN